MRFGAHPFPGCANQILGNTHQPRGMPPPGSSPVEGLAPSPGDQNCHRSAQRHQPQKRRDSRHVGRKCPERPFSHQAPGHGFPDKVYQLIPQSAKVLPVGCGRRGDGSRRLLVVEAAGATFWAGLGRRPELQYPNPAPFGAVFWPVHILLVAYLLPGLHPLSTYTANTYLFNGLPPRVSNAHPMESKSKAVPRCAVANSWPNSTSQGPSPARAQE